MSVTLLSPSLLEGLSLPGSLGMGDHRASLAQTSLPYVEVASLTRTHLSLQTKPVDPTVDGGAQVQQVVNIECVSDFTEAPVLNIQFR